MVKKLIINLILILAIISCTSQKSDQSKENLTYKGTYIFDAPAFKLALKHMDHPILNGSPAVFDDLLEDFKGYKIVVTENEATTYFKKQKTKGKLKLVSQTDNEYKFLMSPPKLQDKKQDVMFVFTNNSLLIDPVDQSRHKLYFKKMK